MSESVGSDLSASASKNNIEVIYENENVESSGEEPPIEEWSSISNIANPYEMDTEKIKLFKKGLYDPGSGEVCTKYFIQSQSSVFRHPYFNYPSVKDPGIESALLDPKPASLEYAADGTQLYLDLCKETNVCPIRLVYEGLKKPVLNLSYYCIRPSGIRPLAKALERNPNVKILNLSESFLDFDACYHLAQMIKCNSEIKELILDGCKVGEKGLQVIASSFPDNITMTGISLARCNLGDNGGKFFGKYMLEKRFTSINLSNNNIGIKTCTALTATLADYNSLVYLDLSWNPLVSATVVSNLLKVIAKTGDFMEELNLSYSGIDSEKVAEALAEVTLIGTLRVLNLRNNLFKDDCADKLIKNLPQSKLHTLDLSNNPFTPAGACILLSIMLDKKAKLKNLYLDNICVNRSFIKILKEVKKMKNRKRFVVTYDKVLHDWIAIGEDPRRLLLRRGAYMGAEKNKDMIEFLLSLSYAAENLRAKEILVMAKDKKIPVNNDWVEELLHAFPGPVIDTDNSIDSAALREYIRRLWPEKKLPDDWKPPIMIRVDVKRKKQVANTGDTGKKSKKKKK